MGWKQTCTYFLLAFLALLGASSSPLAGLPGDGGPDECPVIEAYVSHAEGTLLVRAEGPALAAAVLRVALIQTPSATGLTASNVEIPFVFDQKGEWELAAMLDGFQTVEPMDLLFDVQLVGSPAPGKASNAWGLRIRRIPEGAPNAPASPTGGYCQAAAPGTTTPLFPVTWASILVPGLAGPNPEHLVFYCTVPGVEGVLPVN